MTISASSPASRAAHATACAWLPAEIEITPRARSSSVSSAIRFSAPRTLNEPVRWKSSALKCASAPSRSESVAERSSGVRWTRPAIVSRGALDVVDRDHARETTRARYAEAGR